MDDGAAQFGRCNRGVEAGDWGGTELCVRSSVTCTLGVWRNVQRGVSPILVVRAGAATIGSTYCAL